MEHQTGEEDNVENFCKQWQLNSDASNMMLGLTPEMRELVMSNYTPKADSSDVSGDFITYATNLEAWMTESPESVANVDEAYQAFCSQYDLNMDAQRKLMELHPAAREIVMHEFKAPEGASEVNGRLIMFASSVDKRFKRDPIHAFCSTWGLNDDAHQKLLSLSPAAQQIVMKEFSPKEAASELSGKFIMFASSVQKRVQNTPAAPMLQIQPKTYSMTHSPMQAAQASWNAMPQWEKPQKGMSKGQWADGRQFTAAPSPLGAMKGQQKGSVGGEWSRSQKPTLGAHSGVDDAASTAFCNTWNLNEDAQLKLMSLSPSAQEIVMQQFKPPGGASEVSGKFIMFAASVQKRVEAQGPPPVDPLIAFCNHWGLNGDAHQKLLNLAPEAQEIVMREFGPPAGATETSGLFIVFASSVQKRLNTSGPNPTGFGKGASVVGKGQPHVANASPAGLQAGGGYRFAGYAQKGGGQQGDSISEFCAQWELNEDAHHKLSSLSPSVLEIVMREFKASPSPAGLSGKLIMFASSVQKRVSSGAPLESGKGSQASHWEQSWDHWEQNTGHAAWDSGYGAMPAAWGWHRAGPYDSGGKGGWMKGKSREIFLY